MCDFCENALDEVWPQLNQQKQYSTPDSIKGKPFSIYQISPENIKIVPQNITISRNAFAAAIHYLLENQHNLDHPCEIRSSNSREQAGPLCIAARDQNSDVRCINYILPILQNFNIVELDSGRPNKTWLTL